MSSARQTQSFLIQRFEEAGIRPQTRHGQNFLIDLNLLDLLVRTADLGPQRRGAGSRHRPRLADRAHGRRWPPHVVTVEIDPRLFQLASEELSDLPNVTMLQQDALKNKNTIHPAVLEAVRTKLDGASRQPVQAGRQPALQRRDADPLEPADGRSAAGVADGDDPEGAGRPDLRPAGHEGLLAP